MLCPIYVHLAKYIVNVVRKKISFVKILTRSEVVFECHVIHAGLIMLLENVQ